METVLTAFVFGIANGSLLSLLTFGLVLVYRATGQLNLAHGMIGTIGALVVVEYGITDLPMPVILLVMCGVSALLALATQQIVLRPMRNSPVWSVVVATLAVAILLRTVANIVWGNTPRPFPTVLGREVFLIGPVPVSSQQAVTIVVTAVFLLGFAAFYKFTRLGTALRAMAASRTGADIAGIPTGRLESLVWVIGGVFAGLTAFFGSPITFVTPGMLEPLLLLALAAAAIGGLTSLGGAVAGALMVGVANEFASLYIPSHFRASVPVLVIGLALLLRPQGLTVRRQRGAV
ncbi:branched-chain amino acid ABC transporter permease [Micromonospora sp. NBC_01405]|uniref:branched-chain amino acid ABC transporter permease n=1 Tax=Micromonospora sp. NBC_01405 TaxID=2903589 RepID=UPI0032563D27